MKTPITDAATSDCICNSCQGRDVVPRKVAVALELDRAALMEALERITNRHVIAGSTGDYRQGQLDALAACRDISVAALSAARANFPQTETEPQ